MNELLGILFEMELAPPTKSLVTEAYVVRAFFLRRKLFLC
jgi:hypothetical protein